MFIPTTHCTWAVWVVVQDTRHSKGHFQNRHTHNVNAHHTYRHIDTQTPSYTQVLPTHAPWYALSLQSKGRAPVQIDPLLLSLAVARATVAIVMQGDVLENALQCHACSCMQPTPHDILNALLQKHTQKHIASLHAPIAYLPAHIKLLWCCWVQAHMYALRQGMCRHGLAMHITLKIAAALRGQPQRQLMPSRAVYRSESAAQQATFPPPPTATIAAHPISLHGTCPCMAMVTKHITMHACRALRRPCET